MTAPVYLVRHGESQWNLAGRTQGQSEAPGLTERGRDQARLVAAELASAGITLVVSSDLLRAVETAELIAGALGVPLRTDAAWRERSLGVFEGGPYAETAAALDQLAEQEPIAGGESRRELSERIRTALGALDRNAPVLVVTHGLALQTLLGDDVSANAAVHLLPGGEPLGAG